MKNNISLFIFIAILFFFITIVEAEGQDYYELEKEWANIALENQEDAMVKCKTYYETKQFSENKSINRCSLRIAVHLALNTPEIALEVCELSDNNTYSDYNIGTNKERCYSTVAQTIAKKDLEKAKNICLKIPTFDVALECYAYAIGEANAWNDDRYSLDTFDEEYYSCAEGQKYYGSLKRCVNLDEINKNSTTSSENTGREITKDTITEDINREMMEDIRKYNSNKDETNYSLIIFVIVAISIAGIILFIVKTRNKKTVAQSIQTEDFLEANNSSVEHIIFQYIQEFIKEGIPKGQIEQKLLNYGYTKEQIDQVLSKHFSFNS